MDNSKRVFNSRLRELRESRNLSQEKVAKRIDVSVKEYSKWEENIFNMPMDKICELAKFYRVNSPYIYRFTNDDSEIDTYDFYFDIVCERIGSIVINAMSVIDSSEIPETRLKELRESRNLSQEEVAKKVGVSVREYSKWEENSEGIPLEKIACLSNFYEVSNDYILKISDDDTSPEPIEVEINNNMVVQRIGQVMLEKELNMDFDV